MRISDAQRRARLVRRHYLDGSARNPVEAARSVVVLHATDPATVYLSVLARCASATLSDIAAAMYDDRALVRLLAMRRTMFVVPQELVPAVHYGAALDVAATIRKRLLQQLSTLPTDPELPEDLVSWLAEVEGGVEAALRVRGTATGAQLSEDEPRLRTALLPTTDKAWDVRRSITTQVLTLMGAEGRIVRREPRGAWTSRHHTWEPARAWWPDGLPQVTAEQARERLVREYLRTFGPATESDVAWWTGWSLGVTRKALAAVGPAEVELASGRGLVLADDPAPADESAPVAALLPALDPTPMGWKERGWYLPGDSSPLFDRSGNIGPTIWWAGEVVGGWAVRKDGSIATRLLVDRGREAAGAIDAAAAALVPRLEGAVVAPSFRTPLERELSG
jgi:hypothetical protein